ncbi:MAG: MoaD/ThiS family protein [Pseudomonadota bacterium]
MARVVLVGNLKRFADGTEEVDLPARSIQQLFRQLAERFPAMAPHLEEGLAVAIDGQIYQDTLLQPIGETSEVHVMPQIAGG